MTIKTDISSFSSAEPDSELPRRLPAEWEHHSAILMAWPHDGTDWDYMLDEVQECYLRILEAIAAEETVILLTPDVSALPKLPSGVVPVEIPTNDT